MGRRALLVALAAGLAIPAAAQAAPSLSKIGDFVQPTYVTAPPGDARLFVVEQPGRVQVVSDGVAKPFLDITAITDSGGSEQGLLSMAFPRDYAASGRFYVYLTSLEPAGRIQVREYRRSATDPDRADPASGRTILEIDHSRFDNHNGGQLQFGPDGKLWVGTGDGGDGNDTLHNAQNPGSLLGKILRVDPLAGGAPEIFALGLRNPWRFSFDRQTGDLTIADVGQSEREEIDVAPAPGWRGVGANYGWPCFEGTRVNTDTDRAASSCSTLSGDVKPVLERTHSGDGFCSITGGYVVRDPGLPTLAGRYLYSDFCQGELRSLVLADPRSDAGTGVSVENPTSFGEDASGRIYVASRSGPVYRLEDPAAAGAGTGPPGGPGGGAADTAKPRLRVRVTGARTLVPRRRLRVAVTANELVSVRAGGRLRGVGRFKSARRQLRAGRRTVLTVRITRRTARKLRRTLHRKRVIAAMTILARDAAGNQRRVTRRIRIARRR